MRTASGRWLARLASALASVVVVLVVAVPAAAHEVGGVGATNFRTTLSELTPSVSGLSLRVIENGSRLELRNDTATEVQVAGYGQEPYLRVGPAGVFVNDNSPATYLNQSRFSTTPVPSGVDGAGPPSWRRVGTAPVWRWHDHRIHWMVSTLPPSVAAAPTEPHHVSDWRIELDYGGQRVTAVGSLDWVPGGSPWPWLALVVLVAAAVAVAPLLRRPHQVLAAAAAALLGGELVHGVGVMLVTAGSLPERLDALLGADAVLVWPLTVFAAWLLWRGHARAIWLCAAAGFVAATTIGLDDAPVWWRSSSPSALPVDVNRATVAVIVGLGIGLVLAVAPMLRRHAAPSRPWTGDGAGADRAAPASAPMEQAPADGPPADGPPEDGPPADGPPATSTRRGVVGYLAAGALGALAGAATGGTIATTRGPGPARTDPAPLTDVGARTVAFYADRQAGIDRPARAQATAWVAGFDLAAGVDRDGLRELLRRWTDAAAKLTAGKPLGHPDDAVVAGLGPAALTITVGFGPSIFGKAGIPESARPEALVPLPAFAGERLDAARSDGDLGVVIAGDDAVVVAHAARVLARLAATVAGVRWQMRGFNAARGSGSDSGTPRNLMGQLDGTNNPKPGDPDFATRIFAAGPGWLHGGSYLVVRRIRMLLDDWDRVPVDEQERVIGRRKDTGAPLSGGEEHTPANFGARGPDGSLGIPATAHMRLAAPAFNEGAAMLRRGFSYVDGDEAGLLFLAWQADPRRGFIPVQRRLVAADALGRFIRHETSALFAVPAGAVRGGYLGQVLLEKAESAT